MPELHDTIMGRKLIEHTLPEIARQLERIANALHQKDESLIRLQERYKTLSELDADPKSTHRLSRKVNERMGKALAELKNQELCKKN